jgi:hypothetical protein
VFFLFYLIFIIKHKIMAKVNDIHSVIVAAENANLSAHTYTEIYGGTAGCSIVINGVTIAVASSSNISVIVRSVSGGTGCWLLGEEVNVTRGTLLL